MVHRPSAQLRIHLLAASCVLACACGGSRVGNGTPHVAAIPQQITTGGSAVTLDLSTYVTDRESDALTYAVVTGGGSFTGSTYTYTFPTMGDYTVEIQVTDAVGNATTASFDVRVTSANYAVVNEDTSGIMLLDTMTNSFVAVAQNAAQPTFATGLDDGRLVYSLGNGAGKQLYLYDPFTREARQIGTTLTYATYLTKTSDGAIVIQSGAPADTDLFFYEPGTNLLTEMSAVSGEIDGNPMVNSADLVFYERGDLGQGDIYYFDPVTRTSTAVSTDANDEDLLAVLADGGIVFSRRGVGGEHDLFYFKREVGVVEIGTNVSALATADKAFGGSGTGGQVVFTADDGSSVDLYWWSPNTGLAAAIATSGTFAVEGVGAGNEVVYRSEVSSTEHDLFFFDLDTSVAGTVRNSTDIGSVLAITTDGTTAWAIVKGSGAAGASAVSLVASPVTHAFASATAVSLGGKLGNGDVVVVNAGATAIGQFDVSAGAWATISGTGLVYGGPGIDAGDFVYGLSVSAQMDLKMWDDSATTSVDVSTTTGDDTYAGATADGTILFTRVVAGNSNTDLFVWDASTDTRLTDEDTASLLHDHTVCGFYAGAR